MIFPTLIQHFSSRTMKIPHRSVFFVRHGERIDNIQPDWKLKNKGRSPDDPWLSERGHLQAREVGRRLASKKVDYIFTSPFTRCLQTTAGILSELSEPLPKIFVEKGFGESLNVCCSPPGYPSIEETKKILPFSEDYKPILENLQPEGDFDAGCSERIAFTLRMVLKNYPTGNILVVSHASPIAACHMALKTTWSYVGQCTFGQIDQEGQTFICKAFNSKDHLSDKENLRDVQSPEKAPIGIPTYAGPHGSGFTNKCHTNTGLNKK